MNKEEISKMTVPDLKAALKELGLPVTGKKDDLVQRLLAAKTDSADADAPAAVDNGDSEAAAEAAAAAEPAEAAAEAPATTSPEPAAEQADAPVPAPAKPSKHAPIVFNSTAAGGAANAKVEVVKPAAQEAKEVAKSASPPPVSATDKIKLRAERFKDPEVEKAKQRAQRFNLVHPELEKEKELKRAERFGIAHPELEDAKKRQRAERFGVVDPKLKMELRKERFKPLASAAGTTAALSDDQEARKKARAERFASAS